MTNSPNTVGYARVSTGEQDTAAQLDVLKQHGVIKTFHDKAVSGSSAALERPQFKAMLDYLREGDVVVVVRLDRLGRSLKDLIATVNFLQERGIGFRSLTENIDTTTSAGTLVFHLFGALAEFERNLIRDRTIAGLNAARARGRFGGRRDALTPAKKKAVIALYNAETLTVQQIAEQYGVARTTVYKAIKEAKAAEVSE